jgi:translation initiation factor 1
MSKKEKNRVGVVYSTNPDFQYELDQGEQSETLIPSKQILRIHLDKKQRKGKEVTLIAGFVGQMADCEALGKILKQKCGVGGAVKDNEIILQGDHRTKVLAFLLAADYKLTKISGG